MDRFLEFAGNHTLLVSALAVSFFVLVFTELRRKASGMLSVEPQEAVKLINADAAVIDLRNAEAFSRATSSARRTSRSRSSPRTRRSSTA